MLWVGVATIQKELLDTKSKLSELERLTIAAPRDGTLFRLNVNVLNQGQAVKEGDELFTIVPDISGLAVELRISGKDIPFVERGDRVLLHFEGWPVAEVDDWPSEAVGAFGGEVMTIDPTDDGTGKFRILVKSDGKDSWPDARYLRPGVRANGWVMLKRSLEDTNSGGN